MELLRPQIGIRGRAKEAVNLLYRLQSCSEAIQRVDSSNCRLRLDDNGRRY